MGLPALFEIVKSLDPGYAGKRCHPLASATKPREAVTHRSYHPFGFNKLKYL